jgi:hypothetical protein
LAKDEEFGITWQHQNRGWDRFMFQVVSCNELKTLSLTRFDQVWQRTLISGEKQKTTPAIHSWKCYSEISCEYKQFVFASQTKSTSFTVFA